MTNHQQNINFWLEHLQNMSPEEILAWAAAEFSGTVTLASSLGLEDQLLTDLIARQKLNISIFTLDTGRLFPETYDLLHQTEDRYGLRFNVFYPEASHVEEMVAQHGINLFRESVALRKECCGVRKVEPLRRALAGQQAWITGLRRNQSLTREAVPLIEWDKAQKLVKLNPLAAWNEQQVRNYLNEYHVPYNPLHDCGFPTIGCACCTRAVQAGEDIRSGRWWWEAPEHKECGLHWDNGKAIRLENSRK